MAGTNRLAQFFSPTGFYNTNGKTSPIRMDINGKNSGNSKLDTGPNYNGDAIFYQGGQYNASGKSTPTKLDSLTNYENTAKPLPWEIDTSAHNAASKLSPKLLPWEVDTTSNTARSRSPRLNVTIDSGYTSDSGTINYSTRAKPLPWQIDTLAKDAPKNLSPKWDMTVTNNGNMCNSETNFKTKAEPLPWEIDSPVKNAASILSTKLEENMSKINGYTTPDTVVINQRDNAKTLFSKMETPTRILLPRLNENASNNTGYMSDSGMNCRGQAKTSPLIIHTQGNNATRIRSPRLYSNVTNNHGTMTNHQRNGMTFSSKVDNLARAMSPKLDVNVTNNHGYIPLHQICDKSSQSEKDDNNDIKMMKMLTRFKPAVNMKTNHGDTALHLALQNLRSPMFIEALIEIGGIDVNIKNNLGYTPLHQIFVSGYKQQDTLTILKLLLRLNPDPNLHTSDGRRTILHYIIEERSAILLNTLIEALGMDKINANLKNKDGCTALIQLLLNGNNGFQNEEQKVVETLKSLLKLRVDVHVKTIEGKTALHLAVSRNSLGCVKALLGAGANVNDIDGQGCTAICNAVKPINYTLKSDPLKKMTNPPSMNNINFQFLNPEIVRYLIDNGAQIDIAATNGYTPLLIAVITRQMQMVKYMVENNKSISSFETKASTYLTQINIQGLNLQLPGYRDYKFPPIEYYGVTPMLIAVYDTNPEMVRLLLQGGALVNATNDRKESALHLLVKDKISATANIYDEQEKQKIVTQKHSAILEIVQILLDNGIDLNLKDDTGESVLHYVIREGKCDMASSILLR